MARSFRQWKKKRNSKQFLLWKKAVHWHSSSYAFCSVIHLVWLWIIRLTPRKKNYQIATVLIILITVFHCISTTVAYSIWGESEKNKTFFLTWLFFDYFIEQCLRDCRYEESINFMFKKISKQKNGRKSHSLKIAKCFISIFLTHLLWQILIRGEWSRTF